MFRKENSSCSTSKHNKNANEGNTSKQGGKKNKKGNAPANNVNTSSSASLDVPLRKSDVRNLKQKVKNFFFSFLSNESEEKEQREQLISAVLDAVFVSGQIASRNLNHSESGKLVLYVRLSSPSSIEEALAKASNKNNSDNNSEISIWPYASSQIIWIHQPPMPNSKQEAVELPTVALLSVLPPNSMPTVYIPSPASQFLCRGAHLMRAGMCNFPSHYDSSNDGNTANAPQSIHQSLKATPQPPRYIAMAIVGNPQPLAVGMLDDGVFSANDIGANTKGVGATVWTCYGDDVWQQQWNELQMLPSVPTILSQWGGANFNDGHYGNVGFFQGERVVPIVQQDGEDDEEEDGDDDDEQQSAAATSAWDANEPTDADAEPVVNGEAPSTEAPTEESVQGENSHINKTQKDYGERDAATSGDGEETQATEPEPLSQDDLLHHSVCKALLTSVTPKDLPMTVANFYANHVLPSRPPNTTIQLKQTKYKKFGNYLQEKAADNLVTLGPGPNKSNQDKFGYLTAFDKRHSELLAYKNEHQEEIQEAQETKQSAAAAAKLKLVLVNLFVVPHHFVSLLRLDSDDVKAVNASSSERAGTGMLTATEVRNLLEKYLEREQLADFDEARIDGPLFDALYKKKKTISNDVTSIARKDLADDWLAAMNPAYAIVQMPGNKVQALGKGQPPKVQVEVSMRQSRKFVTKIRGMEAYGVNGHVLARDLGKRLAAQATIETQPEKGAALAKGCVEVVLGGNFADEVEALLLGDEKLCPGHGGIKNSDYRLPKNSVDVVLRKGVPARKKRATAGKKGKK